MFKDNWHKSLGLHAAIIVALFFLQFVLPEYHHLSVTRIMLLAIFAMGFNLLFGYSGLLSLGHAMFFSAGMYGAGLVAYHLSWSVPAEKNIACPRLSKPE